MIFLSASVPCKGREYYGTENVFAIREAIIAFTTICVQYGIRFYFGGHPAITPLVWQVATQTSCGKTPLIDIYQSNFFGTQIPKEVANFDNVHFTPAVENSMKESVDRMRETMFSENETECAVFIGGMQGVIVEYEMLKSKYPKAEYYAFASTGGAAVDLYENIGKDIPILTDSYAYMSIFKTLLLPFKSISI